MSYMLFRNTSGPSQCGLTLVYYVYEKFYNQHHYGIASALDAVLLEGKDIKEALDEAAERAWKEILEARKAF